MRLSKFSVAGLSALGPWRAPAVEKVFVHHHYTTTVLSTTTATETISVDIPATTITTPQITPAYRDSSTSGATFELHQYTSPPEVLFLSASPVVHSVPNASTSIHDPSEPTTSSNSRNFASIYSNVALLSSTFSSLLTNVLNLYMSFATAVWVLATLPIVWLFGHGDASVYAARSQWLVYLGYVLCEPRLSIQHLLMTIVTVMFSASALHFSAIVIYTYPTKVYQDWIAALKRGNGLCWALLVFALHSPTFGLYGSQRKPLAITAAQLRHIYKTDPCPAAKYLLMLAAWLEGQDFSYAALFFDHMWPRIAAATRSISQIFVRNLEQAYEQRNETWNRLYNDILLPPFKGYVLRPLLWLKSIFWDNLVFWIFVYVGRRVTTVALFLYPRQLVLTVSVWWAEAIALDIPGLEQLCLQKAKNLSLKDQMKLFETIYQFQAQLEYIDKEVLPELALRCKAYRNTLHATLHHCNYQRELLDVIAALNKTTRWDKPLSWYKDLMCSHKLRLVEDENPHGIMIQLYDERERFLNRSSYAGLDNPRLMKRLTSLNKYVGSGRATGNDTRPVLFDDEGDIESERLNPWHMEALFPGVEFPEWQPFDVQDVKMSPFIDACEIGGGIEAAKKLGKIPEWAC